MSKWVIILSRYLGFEAVENGEYYFVSYNSNDERIVSEYAVSLHNAGVPMWYDDGLKVGEKWEKQIAEKIAGCKAVIIFLSKNTLRKEESFVHKEYKMACFYDKQIFVVLLDKIEKNNIPFDYIGWWIEIIERQTVCAYDCKSNIDCTQKIIDAIGENGVVDPSTEIFAQQVLNKLLNKHDIKDYFSPTTKRFKKKLENAKKSYAPLTAFETPLILKTPFVLSNGSSGFVLTDKNLYVKWFIFKSEIPLKEIRCVVMREKNNLYVITDKKSYRISNSKNEYEAYIYISFWRELLDYLVNGMMPEFDV